MAAGLAAAAGVALAWVCLEAWGCCCFAGAGAFADVLAVGLLAEAGVRGGWLGFLDGDDLAAPVFGLVDLGMGEWLLLLLGDCFVDGFVYGLVDGVFFDGVWEAFPGVLLDLVLGDCFVDDLVDGVEAFPGVLLGLAEVGFFDAEFVVLLVADLEEEE